MVRRKAKHAQIQSQVFVFIFLAVVAGMTFYFGYMGILKIIQAGEKVDIQDKIIKLENVLSGIDYLDEKIILLPIPPGYEVCFLRVPEAPDGLPDYTSPLLQQQVEADRSNSVYLVGEFIKPIKTDVPVHPLDSSGNDISKICIKSSDAIKEVNVTGKGKYMTVQLKNG